MATPHITIYMKNTSSLFFSLCLLWGFSCQNQIPEADDPSVSQTQIIKEVEHALEAFYIADTSRDAEAVINLLWPEYSMLADGNRIRYPDVVEGSNAFMSTLTLFHTEWTEVEIIPVSENAAISSFLFRDSIIDKSGNLTRAKGPNTFLWQKRDGEWRVLYGDADHYPITPSD